MNDDVIEKLKAACAGLIYPSETDAPLEVFQWEKRARSAREEVIMRAGKDQQVQEISFEAFFDELKDTDDAERFAQLCRTIKALLTTVKVYRVGTRRIDVYVIGDEPGGGWAGLKTISVET